MINTEILQNQFLKNLHNELRLHAYTNLTADTIYIGGGTPSLLAPADVKSILKTICNHYTLPANPEISIEVNPNTINKRKLAGYRDAGVNRLSIGVQSFNNEELNILGRLHTAEQALEAVRIAAETGFEHIGVDLIFGLPGQSLNAWRRTVHKAGSLPVDHISAYTLTWTENTPMRQKILSGQYSAPDEDVISEMYVWTSRTLTVCGYDHYEISNFAKPGCACRHNLGYWNGSFYLGFGPSAHSFFNDRRSWNVPDVKEYIHIIKSGKLPVAGYETLNKQQKQMEKLTLGLRTNQGIPLPDNKSNASYIEQCLENGLAEIRGKRFILTAKGFLMADEMALRLTNDLKKLI